MSTKLKICGLTRAEDFEACAAHQIEAIGINLWPKSKRAVSVEAAASLLSAAPVGPMKVGVFVDADPDQVRVSATRLGLDAIQLHGDHPVGPYTSLGWPYVWVLRGTPDLATLTVPSPDPRWVLLDAAAPGYGGSGETTDWTWAAQAVKHLAPLPVWLAGGITVDNAAEAIRSVGPAGLDVASGAETDGLKDPAKIAALRAITRPT